MSLNRDSWEGGFQYTVICGIVTVEEDLVRNKVGTGEDPSSNQSRLSSVPREGPLKRPRRCLCGFCVEACKVRRTHGDQV